nr:lysosomal Pro-X carboxypeptidase [Ipomoea batatas]
MASSPPFILCLLFMLFVSSQPSFSLPRSSKSAARFRNKYLRLPSKTIGAPQYKYEIRYFEQRLDHFSFADLSPFRHRYLINTDHWLGPSRLGPIFFYCGNEGDIEWFAANSGLVWELAPRFGAMVIFPEHRYYGESMPYGSREEAYKNATTLAYLTAEQALADFAVLITELKRNTSAQACPVVLFGGSYGGMLATWMRLKYPHIAIGALAASAPILQFEDVVDPDTFYNIVSNDFRRESVSCFNTIKESWDVITSVGSTNGGLSLLSKVFHLCGRIDSLPDGTNILQRIFEGVSVYYNYTGTVDCFDLDDDPHGMSGWDWQACTEMVMPVSSNSKTSMFPAFDYEYSADEEYCYNSYHVIPRPTWITTEFGGHDIKTALGTFGSNIIFSNGLLDPWSGGSVLQNISETIVALVTKKEALKAKVAEALEVLRNVQAKSLSDQLASLSLNDKLVA